MEQIYAAVDIGTSQVKALAATATRRAEPITLPTPWKHQDGTLVLDPEQLVHTTLSALHLALHGLDVHQPIAAVGITSMGEAGVWVTPGGTTYGALVGWQDTSATRALYEALLGSLDARVIYQRTGLHPHPSLGVFRMQAQAGTSLPRQSRWLSVADFVVWRLSGGRAVTHASLAARTMAYNWQRQQWDDDLLATACLTQRDLPDVVQQLIPAGTVVMDEADALRGAALVHCGHDHAAAAYGADLALNGVLDSSGTAEPLIVRTAEAQVADAAFVAGINWERALWPDNSFLALMPTRGGGAVEVWARRVFGIGREVIERVPPSMIEHSGLSFDVAGWRDGRATWTGVTAEAPAEELYYAVLRALSDDVAEHLLLLRQVLRLPYAELKLTGGAARHPLWLALRQGHIRERLSVMYPPEGAVVGALRGAMHAVGAEDIAWREWLHIG